MRKVLILSSNILVTILLLLTSALIYYVGMQGFLFAWILNLMLMMCAFVFTGALSCWDLPRLSQPNMEFVDPCGYSF